MATNTGALSPRSTPWRQPTTDGLPPAHSRSGSASSGGSGPAADPLALPAHPHPAPPARRSSAALSEHLPAAAARPHAAAAAAPPRQSLARLATAAGRVVANSAPGAEFGHGLKVGIDALPVPQLSAMLNRTFRPNKHANAGQLRHDLQTALTALGAAGPANHRAAQETAHQALGAYGRHAGTVADGLLPILHKALVVGVAGTTPAFGIARSSGIAASDAAGKALRRQPIQGGFSAQTSNVKASESSLQDAAAQWAGGALAGALGNMAGQHLIAPLVNKLPIQHVPVDARAVVPDEMVAAMNNLKPGSGDALRASVAQQQKEISNLGSDTNIALGQAAFDTATAIKTAAQGSDTLGLGRAIGAGVVTSGLAGAAIGTGIGVNAGFAKIKVPDLAQLRTAVQNRTPLDQVPKADMPLFYSKRMQPGDAKSLQATLLGSPLREPRPVDARANAGALSADALAAQRRPTGAQAPRPSAAMQALNIGATVMNVATSVAERGGRMAVATIGPLAAGVAAPLIASLIESPSRANAARAGIQAMGIHHAIRPWFQSVASGIPAADARIGAGRQQAVDAAAPRWDVHPNPAARAAGRGEGV